MIARVSEVMVWAVLVLSWSFVVTHTVLSWVEWRRYGRTPWWRTLIGWLLTSAVASLGVSFSFIAVAMVWPALALLPWFQWAYVLSFSGVVAVLLGKNLARVWLHLRTRREG